VLRWYRAIVPRKWTYGNTPERGRPAIPAATVELIVRLAGENRAWGYGKLQGGYCQVKSSRSASRCTRARFGRVAPLLRPRPACR
jgi:hypothetical protein